VHPALLLLLLLLGLLLQQQHPLTPAFQALRMLLLHGVQRIWQLLLLQLVLSQLIQGIPCRQCQLVRLLPVPCR
jgi:hypothetical protein